MSLSQNEVVDYIKNLKLGEVKSLIERLEDELGVLIFERGKGEGDGDGGHGRVAAMNKRQCNAASSCVCFRTCCRGRWYINIQWKLAQNVARNSSLRKQLHRSCCVDKQR